MEEEMKCLADNGTWVLVDLPHDRKTIKCRWVYITKCDTKGNVMHLQSRLITNFFLQPKGIDYKETFAPVARLQ